MVLVMVILRAIQRNSQYHAVSYDWMIQQHRVGPGKREAQEDLVMLQM